MTTSLVRGSTTVTPEQVLGWDSTRQSGNVLHDVLGRSDFDVTFGVAGLRALTLKFLFPTLATALAAETLHTAVGKIQLSDTDFPALNMLYVPSGAINVALDDDSAKWILTVDVQEVL